MAEDQPSGTSPWWARAAERYGLPTVLLMVLCTGLVTAAYRAGVFLAPIIERVTTQHVETMKTTAGAVEEMVETQKHQEETLGSLDENVRGIRQTQESLSKTQELIGEAIRKQAEMSDKP